MADASLAVDHRSGVYEIVCAPTGKRYVGSARDFHLRWKAHRFQLGRGSHHSPHLQSAWKKHGADAFRFNVLLLCAPRDCVMYEQIAMDALRPQFNVAAVAGSCLGVRHTEATREKQRMAKLGNTHTLGKKYSDEARANIARGKLGNTHTKGRPRNRAAVEATAAAHRGMKRSIETRAKIAEKARGRVWSEEAKARLSAAITGRKMPEAQRLTLIGNKRAAGRKQTPEEKARRGAAVKAAWDAKRAAGIPWR